MMHSSLTCCRGFAIVSLLMLLKLTNCSAAGDDIFNVSVPEMCSFCKNGEPVSLPDKKLNFPGVPVDNCGAIDSLASQLFPLDGDICNVLQSLGTVCGCEKAEGACDLCVDGSKVQYPERELGFLADLFQGVVPTCEIFEGYLHSLPTEDSFCSMGQSLLAKYCGCNAADIATAAQDQEGSLETSPRPCSICKDATNVTLPDMSIPIENFPFPTCGVLSEASLVLLEEGTDECTLLQSFGSYCGCTPRDDDDESSIIPCTVCMDGTTPVPDPNKTLDVLADQFLGFVVPCGIYESMMSSYEAGSNECRMGQTVGVECGCAPIEDHCEICPGGGIPQEHLLDMFEPFGISCELFEMSQYTMKDGSFECFSASLVSWYCGCNDGKATYFGAKSHIQRLFMLWLQRISASLSILGSLAISFDVLWSKTKRGQVFNQIMLGISFFDFWSSVSWLLGAAVTPPYFTEDPLYGYPTGVPDAIGTEASCTAFGFLLGWGVTTSILYNSALSLYYRKVIVGGWRGGNFTKRVRTLFHGIPILIGTSLALAGIPFYTSNISTCTIPVLPLEDHWPKLLVFYWMPLGSSIFFVIINTALVYFEVRAQSKKGKKWSFERKVEEGQQQKQSFVSSIQFSLASRGRRDVEEQKKIKSNRRKDMEYIVFWQSFWYLLAFVGTMPLLLLLTLGNVKLTQSYVFSVLVSLLGPIQGLNNALIYFRARFVKKAKAALRRGCEVISHVRKRNSPATKRYGTDSQATDAVSANFERSAPLPPENEDPSVAILSEAELDRPIENEMLRRAPESMQNFISKAPTLSMSHSSSFNSGHVPTGTEAITLNVMVGDSTENRRGSNFEEATNDDAPRFAKLSRSVL